MGFKRLYLIISVLVLSVVVYPCGAQEEAGNDQSEQARQLKINKQALLSGSNDAAMLLLLDKSPEARAILLELLEQSDDPKAREVICRALAGAAQEKRAVKNKQDFIRPLLGIILSTSQSGLVESAAQATLIFEYEDISGQLNKIFKNESLPINAKINALAVLKVQPKIEAVLKLLSLLESSDAELANAAAQTLSALSIPVGKDKKTRQQISNEIKRMGTKAFLRYWHIRQQQEEEMLELRKEIDFWQKQHLELLDKYYAGLEEDAKRAFLTEKLGSDKSIIKLWSLKEVSRKLGGTNPKLPLESMGPILVALISDADRDVRLNTARLMPLIRELDSAEALLKQYISETDDEVRTEVFVALGWSCYYGSSADSKFKVSAETKFKTLQIAEQYLVETDVNRSLKGANIIRKLFEQNGFNPIDITRCLSKLSQRYSQSQASSRGEFLNIMGGLCAQSICKVESAQLFKPLFTESMEDETDSVRLSAAEGLIYIDPAQGLGILRNYTDDKSLAVQKKIIMLAGKVGGVEDLDWLMGKAGKTNGGRSAWDSMLRIFTDAETGVLKDWVDKLSKSETIEKLSDEQIIAFYEFADRKAEAAKQLEMQRSSKYNLAKLYQKTGGFEQAAKQLGWLWENAETESERGDLFAQQLEVYWSWANLEGVKELISNSLAKGDLDPNGVVAGSIEKNLSEPLGGLDAQVILKMLEEIKTSDLIRGNWKKMLDGWKQRFSGSNKTGS